MYVGIQHPPKKIFASAGASSRAQAPVCVHRWRITLKRRNKCLHKLHQSKSHELFDSVPTKRRGIDDFVQHFVGLAAGVGLLLVAQLLHKLGTGEKCRRKGLLAIQED